MHGYECAAGGDIECSREFQEVLAFGITASDKERYGQRESGPFPSLCFYLRTIQTSMPFPTEVLCLSHLSCQTNTAYAGGKGRNTRPFRDLRG